MNGFADNAKRSKGFWSAAIGFGLLWALFSSALQTDITQNGYRLLLVRSISEVVMFAIAIFLPEKAIRSCRKHGRSLLAVLSVLAACMPLAVFAAPPQPNEAAFFAQNLLLGLTISSFSIAWCVLLATRFSASGVRAAVTVGALVVVVMYLCFWFLLSQVGRAIVAAVLPLALYGIILAFFRISPTTAKENSVEDRREESGELGARGLVSIGAIALPFTLMLGMLPLGGDSLIAPLLVALLAFACFAIASSFLPKFSAFVSGNLQTLSSIVLVVGFVSFSLEPVGYTACCTLTFFGVMAYDFEVWCLAFGRAVGGGDRGIKEFCKVKLALSVSHMAAFALVLGIAWFDVDQSVHPKFLLAALSICLVVEMALTPRNAGATPPRSSSGLRELGIGSSSNGSEPEDAGSLRDFAPSEFPAHDGEGSFAEKCERLAAEAKLTNREAEIMALLARGYNRATIMGSLFIAEGTLNTHTLSIYRKIGIHSQQELMNIIDGRRG